MGSRRLIIPFIFLLLSIGNQIAKASPYIEVGTSIGSVSNPAAYFQQASLTNVGSPFILTIDFFVPTFWIANFAHFDFGVQNRLTMLSATDPTGATTSLDMETTNLAMRFEFWRFFVGGGYSPLNFVNKTGGGLTSLHTYSGTTSYYYEAGAVWWIVPEFQIIAAYAMEYGKPSGGGTSPSPAIEYGLHFRFPLSPTESGHGGNGAKWDGFRYPFGIMK